MNYLSNPTPTDWISCDDQLPPNDIIVNTKIDDERGERNEQLLRRRGRLWFEPKGVMYVYYEPTYWRRNG